MQLFFTIIANSYDFFRFLNFCLCDRLDNMVLHTGLSHSQDTNITLSIGPEDYILVGFFFDVCGTVSGKQYPRSQEGVSNFYR